ncbi:MAG: hypothetical protein JNL30_06875 [Rubrivivax sp.]|nr:hypothetical protein [Rubrivivax sp.]
MIKVFALFGAWVAVPTLVWAQTWNYVSVGPDGKASPASIRLTEKDGAATFQMNAPQLNACWKGPLKATVERTATTIVITPEPPLRDCEQVRFVIKADGTGGQRQSRRDAGAEWVSEARDRKLTLAQ